MALLSLEIEKFNQIYLEKLLEHHTNLSALKTEIDKRKDQIIESTIFNHKKILRQAESIGSDLLVKLHSVQSEKQTIELKLKENQLDENQLEILRNELQIKIQNLEKFKFKLKFELNDCVRCRNEITLEDFEQRQTKRKRTSDSYELDSSTEILPTQSTAFMDIPNKELTVLNRVKATKPTSETDYTKAIKQHDPETADYYNKKGAALYELKNNKAALECFNKAIEMKPNEAEFHNNKGNVYDDLKEYEFALKSYERAIEHNPKESIYYFNKGCCLYYTKNYRKSIEFYDQAIELNRLNHDFYSKKGFSLHYLKAYQAAIDCYDASIKLKPDAADTWNLKAMTLEKMKEYGKARTCYDKAIKLDPKI